MNFPIKPHLQGHRAGASHPHSFPGCSTQLWVRELGFVPAAGAGSGSCSSLTLFQMFSQLHTWWAHGWRFPAAAAQVCDPRGHLSPEPGCQRLVPLKVPRVSLDLWGSWSAALQPLAHFSGAVCFGWFHLGKPSRGAEFGAEFSF